MDKQTEYRFISIQNPHIDEPGSISRAIRCLWTLVFIYVAAMAFSWVIALLTMAASTDRHPAIEPTVYLFSPLCAGFAASRIRRKSRWALHLLDVMGTLYAIVSVLSLFSLMMAISAGVTEAIFWVAVYIPVSILWIEAIVYANKKDSRLWFLQDENRRKTDVPKAQDETTAENFNLAKHGGSVPAVSMQNASWSRSVNFCRANAETTKNKALACAAIFGEFAAFAVIGDVVKESAGRTTVPALMMLAFFAIARWTWRSITQKTDDPGVQ